MNTLMLLALMAQPFPHGLDCTHKDTLGRMDRVLHMSWVGETPRISLTEIDILGTRYGTWEYKTGAVTTDPSRGATVFVHEKQIAGCETESGLQDAFYVTQPRDPAAFERGEVATDAYLVFCDDYDQTRWPQLFTCRRGR